MRGTATVTSSTSAWTSPLSNQSHHDPGQPNPHWQLRSYVLGRGDFNDMRNRLPRSVRRKIEPAPEGHVGLVVQAVAGDAGGAPVAALYDTAPSSMATQRIRELAEEIAALFG